VRRGPQTDKMLRKCYFGGGTVAAVAGDDVFVEHRTSVAARFEDGTPNLHAILALPMCVTWLGDVLAPRISAELKEQPWVFVRQRCQSLRRMLIGELSSLRHETTGEAVCVLHEGPVVQWLPEAVHSMEIGTEEFGPIVSFSVVDDRGRPVGYAVVGRAAETAGIELRTGCMCNAGACHDALSLSAGSVKSHWQAGHVCWDENDVVDGVATGVVRVSFGWMTTQSELLQLVSCIR
jgi:molybdenum cofactor sulfurtransferase